MITAVKSRRRLNVRKQSTAIPALFTAQQVQQQAADLLEEITALIADAGEASTYGGHAWRALGITQEQCVDPACQRASADSGLLTHHQAGEIIDLTHDADALLLSIQAQRTECAHRNIGLLIGEAITRLQDVRSLLDQHDFWPQSKPVDPFQAGRELAVAMLRDAERVGAAQDNSAEPLRHYRMGGAQNRFIQPHLGKLIDRPEILDGFSAVLSAWLYQSWVGRTEPETLATLPQAEFEAGVVGEDGTSHG
ncbi:MAG: hypothetical protein PGN26_14365 [Xylophilus ampelinus]